MNRSVVEILRAAVERLSATSSSPRLDAELLLAHALGWSRARLLAERTHVPAPAQADLFAAMLERRAALEPVAYILGHKEFYGLELFVTPATLVPRPETELLVELALAEAHRLRARHAHLIIADIGTGTGAIAIALATHLSAAEIYATDISPEALAVAAANVERHGLAGRLRLLQGNLLAPLPGPVDLLVSNPPYTILAEIEPGVHAHEPHLALDGGGRDGGDIYRRLVAEAPHYLRPGGVLLLEIGAWQGELVAGLVRTAMPRAVVTVHKDLAGHDRVVVAQG